MAKKLKAQQTGVLGQKEQMYYFMGALGSGMIYSTMSSYITDFYMNVMGLGWLFVFLLMILARVWDAVNDPLMGMLMDHLNPKRGKMRSWMFLTPGPVALLTILLFWAPDISETGKMVYAGITYLAWGMTFTVLDIPFWSLPNALTPNEKERGKVISVARTVNGVGSAIPMAMATLLPMVLKKFADNQHTIDSMKFMIMAVTCGIGGFILMQITPFKVKERVPLPEKAKEGKGALYHVLHCKPLMLTAAMSILSGGRYMFQAGAPHVARYAFFLGDLGAVEGMTAAEKTDMIATSMSTVQLMFQLALAAGMFGSMVAVPFLIKRFSYKQLLIASCLLGGASGFVIYFAGYENFWLILPLYVLAAIPIGIINVVAFAMVGDSLDYMEWKTGCRANGVGLACQSFVTILANALATSAIVITYAIVGLDMDTINGISSATGATLLSVEPMQRAAVRGGMFSLVSLIPAISLLVCIIPVLFYDFTGKKKDNAMQELAERRAAVAEAAI